MWDLGIKREDEKKKESLEEGGGQRGVSSDLFKASGLVYPRTRLVQ